MKEMESNDLMDTISVPQGDVLCCAFSGRLLAVGSSDKLVRLFSFDSQDATNFGELVQSPLCSHSFAVYGLAFSHAGSFLASCSQDGRAIIWDVRTGRKLSEFSHEGGSSVRVCQFSPDDRILATGSDDETAVFWDVQSRTLIRSLEGHESSVTALAFTPDGAFLITGSNTGDVRVWDARFGLGRCFHVEKEAHDLGVTCAAFSPIHGSPQPADCSTSATYFLATGGNDDLVKLWRMESPNPAKVSLSQYTILRGHSLNVMCVAFSPNGALLASGGGDKTVIVWEPSRGSQVHRLNYHQRYVTCVAFSGDSSLLVSGSNDKQIAVWRVKYPADQSELPFVGEPYPVKKLSARDAPLADVINKSSEFLWDTEAVCRWLNESVGLEQYCQKFRDNSIDGRELLQLTDPVLRDGLGIDSLGHRNRIMRAIERLGDEERHTVASAPSQQSDNVPHEYRCPITHEIFKDPVIAADGYTYEREAISDWFSNGHRTSPMTNVPLAHMDLTENRMLKMLVRKISC